MWYIHHILKNIFSEPTYIKTKGFPINNSIIWEILRQERNTVFLSSLGPRYFFPVHFLLGSWKRTLKPAQICNLIQHIPSTTLEPSSGRHSQIISYIVEHKVHRTLVNYSSCFLNDYFLTRSCLVIHFYLKGSCAFLKTFKIPPALDFKLQNCSWNVALHFHPNLPSPSW